jgi:hypothetical protein
MFEPDATIEQCESVRCPDIHAEQFDDKATCTVGDEPAGIIFYDSAQVDEKILRIGIRIDTERSNAGRVYFPCIQARPGIPGRRSMSTGNATDACGSAKPLVPSRRRRTASRQENPDGGKNHNHRFYHRILDVRRPLVREPFGKALPLTGGAYVPGRAADDFPVLRPLIRYRNTGT